VALGDRPCDGPRARGGVYVTTPIYYVNDAAAATTVRACPGAGTPHPRRCGAAHLEKRVHGRAWHEDAGIGGLAW